MKNFSYALAPLALISTAAFAQPAEEAAGPAEAATPAEPATPADPATGTAATPAEPATPATPAEPAASAAAAAVTDAEIDSFAKATVKLHAIQADASIAADAKQEAMVAAVTEAGLDAEKYNEIGQATQADPALRAKVQTAMSKHAGHTDG